MAKSPSGKNAYIRDWPLVYKCAHATYDVWRKGGGQKVLVCTSETGEKWITPLNMTRMREECIPEVMLPALWKAGALGFAAAVALSTVYYYGPPMAENLTEEWARLWAVSKSAGHRAREILEEAGGEAVHMLPMTVA